MRSVVPVIEVLVKIQYTVRENIFPRRLDFIKTDNILSMVNAQQRDNHKLRIS